MPHIWLDCRQTHSVAAMTGIQDTALPIAPDRDDAAATEWDGDAQRETLFTHPGFLLRRAHQIFSGLYDEVLGQFGLTHAQWAVLVAVEAFPGIDQTEVSRAAGIDKTSSGRAVERMVARGILETCPGAADRRRKKLWVTAKARDLLPKVRAGSDRFRDILLAPLGEDEQAVFLAALRRFVELNDDHARAPLEMPAGGERK